MTQLRDKITDALLEHGICNPGLADAIEGLVLTELAEQADRLVAATDSGPAFMAGLRTQIEHRAGLLRVVTPETAARPEFRERMARDLSQIAALSPPTGWGALENVR